jgi:hypothetical protein
MYVNKSNFEKHTGGHSRAPRECLRKRAPHSSLECLHHDTLAHRVDVKIILVPVRRPWTHRHQLVACAQRRPRSVIRNNHIRVNQHRAAPCEPKRTTSSLANAPVSSTQVSPSSLETHTNAACGWSSLWVPPDPIITRVFVVHE